MKADKREIVTFVIAALATLMAVWFFLGKMQKEKETARTDLYTLVAPAPDAILSINRPVAFSKYILSRKPERDAFASKIPDIYLSIIQNNRNLPWLLLSFHPQGVIFYAQVGNSYTSRIEKNTLQKAFGSFAPQKQKKDGITFTYYPDAGNRFFGYYQHEGIWVASYSKKLLEEVAQIQRNRKSYLRPDQDHLRKSFDPNAPLNLMVQADSLDLYVSLPDSAEWRVRKGWLGADLFMNENHLCYFGNLPYNSTADSLYTSLGDTLALRLEQAFPQFTVSNQTTRENSRVFYTGCFTSKDQ